MRTYIMALVAVVAMPLGAQAANAEMGHEIFNKRCKMCHNESAERKVGPGLRGVYGREAESGIGSLTEERLHQWLQNPRSLKSNTRMPKYADMQDDDARQSVIDFLKTLH